MIKGMDAAKFLLNLDDSRKIFNKELRTQNGRTFYEGNARLNKYMHLAQNIYIAKYGVPLRLRHKCRKTILFFGSKEIRIFPYQKKKRSF